MDYTIEDNFLHINDWHLINSICCGKSYHNQEDELPYYVNNNIAAEGDSNPFDFYLTHMFYNFNKRQSSSYIYVLNSLIDKINPRALIRIKANLYPRTEAVYYHDFHMDYDFKHSGALYMVNDNDGFTIMHDGTKIESKANRMIFFDPNKLHRSSSCSNAKYRVTINFNYF